MSKMYSRMYRCPDCGHEWKHWHISKTEPAPPCELGCDESAIVDDEAEARRGHMADILASQQAPARGGSNRAKAVDMAYNMAEEQYGMTDMKDNLREGDMAFTKPAAVQTAEAEQITRELVQAGATPEAAQQTTAAIRGQFWQHEKGEQPRMMQAPQVGAGPGAQLMQAVNSQPLAVASAGAAAARREGVDPVALLHKAGKQGALGKDYNVVARG